MTGWINTNGRPPLVLAGLDSWIEGEQPPMGSAPQPPTLVETYQDFQIHVDGGETTDDPPIWLWQHGDAPSLEQCRRDIDEWLVDQSVKRETEDDMGF